MHAQSTPPRRPFWPLHPRAVRLAAAASLLLAARAPLCAQQSLYVANGSQEVINRVDSAGTVSTFAALPGNTDAAGIAFDQGGNFYVADSSGNLVLQVSPAGAVNPTPFATLPANYGVNGLAFDRSGNLYAAGDLSNQISRISPTGVVSLFCDTLCTRRAQRAGLRPRWQPVRGGLQQQPGQPDQRHGSGEPFCDVARQLPPGRVGL